VSRGTIAVNRVRMRAVVDYVRRRVTADGDFLRAMIDPISRGRATLTFQERRDALRVDSTLRLLGVRCLWRAAIVTEQLRRRGVAANVVLAVSAGDPRRAHAECEVGGHSLRPLSEDSVRLR
jgi:hypothetical protein